MSGTEKLMAVRRQLLPTDHQNLRAHIPRLNHELGDVSVKWFHMGAAACTLMERGEYKKVCNKVQGQGLRQLGPDEIARRLQDGLKSEHTKTLSERDRLTARVDATDFFGYGKILRIAYILDSPELVAENERLRNFIDRQNGINGHWETFEPTVAIASIPEIHATDEVLQAFLRIAPETLTFEPPEPTVS